MTTRNKRGSCPIADKHAKYYKTPPIYCLWCKESIWCECHRCHPCKEKTVWYVFDDGPVLVTKAEYMKLMNDLCVSKPVKGSGK